MDDVSKTSLFPFDFSILYFAPKIVFDSNFFTIWIYSSKLYSLDINII